LDKGSGDALGNDWAVLIMNGNGADESQTIEYKQTDASNRPQATKHLEYFRDWIRYPILFAYANIAWAMILPGSLKRLVEEKGHPQRTRRILTWGHRF